MFPLNKMEFKEKKNKEKDVWKFPNIWKLITTFINNISKRKSKGK